MARWYIHCDSGCFFGSSDAKFPQIKGNEGIVSFTSKEEAEAYCLNNGCVSPYYSVRLLTKEKCVAWRKGIRNFDKNSKELY